MPPELALIAAQQHIADLHRAASQHRLVHAAAATTTSGSHAVPAPCYAADSVSFLRWLLQRGHLEPREDRAGGCK
jgi:hypothetical protein